MRIGIDARFFGSIGKGLGRYTQKLIEYLESIDDENQYFIFLKKANFNEYQPQNKNFRKVLADFRWYNWEEQVKFPWLLGKYKLDLMHFPHFNVPLFYSGKFIVTIHDLILLNFPTQKNTTLSPLFYKIKYLVYRLVIGSAVLRSQKIITVSNFTKKDILSRFKKIPQEKIIVTYEACEEYCMLSPEKDSEILSRYGIIRPYIMYVGNAYPHKNLERLVSGFGQICFEKGCQLVMVGKEDYFYKELKKFVQKNNIKNILFTDYVPDHDLDVIFHNADAFAWPSLYEGFGLPPLEAMAKGTPVISSDHPCMKEILGDSVYYFNGKNVDDISKAIKEVFDNKKLRKTLREKGFEQIKKYSWSRMAQKTLKIYQGVAQKQK